MMRLGCLNLKTKYPEKGLGGPIPLLASFRSLLLFFTYLYERPFVFSIARSRGWGPLKP